MNRAISEIIYFIIFAGFLVFLKTENALAERNSLPVIIGESIDATDLPAVIPNEEFVKEKIWPELLRLTKANRNLKIPKILFLNRDEDQRMGRYFGDRIEIYKFGVYKQLTLHYGIDPGQLSDRELGIRIYSVVVHELLHHIYQRQGLMDPAQNHKKMQEDGTAMAVCEFLAKELISNGLACYDTKVNLQYLVEKKI